MKKLGHKLKLKLQGGKSIPPMDSIIDLQKDCVILTPELNVVRGDELVSQTPLPQIFIEWSSPAVVAEFNDRAKKGKCKAAYHINIGGEPVVTFFILTDGVVYVEDNYSALIDMTGRARAESNALRNQLQSSLRFSHALNNIASTYTHFFGEMTPEHKAWMSLNTLTYEEQVSLAKTKASLNPKSDNDGN